MIHISMYVYFSLLLGPGGEVSSAQKPHGSQNCHSLFEIIRYKNHPW